MLGCRAKAAACAADRAAGWEDPTKKRPETRDSNPLSPAPAQVACLCSEHDCSANGSSFAFCVPIIPHLPCSRGATLLYGKAGSDSPFFYRGGEPIPLVCTNRVLAFPEVVHHPIMSAHLSITTGFFQALARHTPMIECACPPALARGLLIETLASGRGVPTTC